MKLLASSVQSMPDLSQKMLLFIARAKREFGIENIPTSKLQMSNISLEKLRKNYLKAPDEKKFSLLLGHYEYGFLLAQKKSEDKSSWYKSMTLAIAYFHHFLNYIHRYRPIDEMIFNFKLEVINLKKAILLHFAGHESEDLLKMQLIYNHVMVFLNSEKINENVLYLLLSQALVFKLKKPINKIAEMDIINIVSLRCIKYYNKVDEGGEKKLNQIIHGLAIKMFDIVPYLSNLSNEQKIKVHLNLVKYGLRIVNSCIVIADLRPYIGYFINLTLSLLPLLRTFSCSDAIRLEILNLVKNFNKEHNDVLKNQHHINNFIIKISDTFASAETKNIQLQGIINEISPKSEEKINRVDYGEFLKLKPEIFSIIQEIKAILRLNKNLVLTHQQFLPLMNRVYKLLPDLSDEAKDPQLLMSHIVPIINFLRSAYEILNLSSITNLIDRIKISLGESYQELEKDSFNKITPELIQSTLDIYKNIYKTIKKRLKNSQKNEELVMVYSLSLPIKIDLQSSLKNRIEINFSLDQFIIIANFFTAALGHLNSREKIDKHIYELNCAICNIFDRFYALFAGHASLFLCHIQAKYFRATYLLVKKEKDVPKILAEIKEISALVSESAAMQFRKINILSSLCMNCMHYAEHLRATGKYPEIELFLKNIQYLSCEIIDIYKKFNNDFFKVKGMPGISESKIYEQIVNDALVAGIFCYTVAKEFKDAHCGELLMKFILGIDQFLQQRGNIILAEDYCLNMLSIIEDFIKKSTSEVEENIRNSLIKIGGVFIANVSSGKQSVYSDLLALPKSFLSSEIKISPTSTELKEVIPGHSQCLSDFNLELTLQEKLKLKDSEIKKVTAELSRLKINNRQLSDSLSIKDKKLDSISKDLSHCRQNLRGIAKKLDKIKTIVDQKDQEIKSTKKNLSEITMQNQRKLTASTQELAKTKQALLEKDQELEAIKASLSTQESVHKQKQHELTHKIQTVTTQSQAEIKRVKSRHECRSSEIKIKHTQEKQALIFENQSLQRLLMQANEKIRLLEESAQTTATDLAQSRAAVRRLNQENTADKLAKEKQCSAFHKKITDLEREVKRLSAVRSAQLVTPVVWQPNFFIVQNSQPVVFYDEQLAHNPPRTGPYVSQMW